MHNQQTDLPHQKKDAVLAVSFGTSFPETRKLTIDRLEERLQQEGLLLLGSESRFYHAWTSGMILRKLRERDHLIIPTVAQAFEQMQQDGIRSVFVQPTHILPGVENDLMKEHALAFADHFEHITFGDPLLTTQQDHTSFIRLFMEAFHNIPADEVILLMGHGTPHFANTAYAALDYECKDLGFSNVYVVTVEAYPGMQNVLRQITAVYPPKQHPRIHLIPLMIVAGDHATNDMAGEADTSLKNILKSEGYEPVCHLHGLGEQPFIQDLFAEHLRRSIDTFCTLH